MTPSEIDHLFLHTSGPRNAKIVVVGEAWGESEDSAKLPLMGHSGREFLRMLRDAGFGNKDLANAALEAVSGADYISLRELYLRSASILLTNVIHQRPPANDFTTFLNPTPKGASKGVTYDGVYPRSDLVSAIRELWQLISHVSPVLIVALGNWPLHILSPHGEPKTTRGHKLPTGIVKWRGSQTFSRTTDAALASGLSLSHSNGLALPSKPIPLLPLIHPAAILREWGWRQVTVHDLRSRAGRLLAGHLSWQPPSLNSTWRPKLLDVERMLNLWLAKASCRESKPLELSVDIENRRHSKFIACIGLADDSCELCIPFFYYVEGQLKPYWTLEEELFIWDRLRSLLEHSNVYIIGQNYIYDSLFLLFHSGIKTLVSFDTMVAHHLLYPGTPKALHYLASMYCHSYCYWKDESDEWNVDELSAELLWQYNCKDVRYTFEIYQLLKQLLTRREGYLEHYNWRMREWKLGYKMSVRGINYDDRLRKNYRQQCMEQALPLQDYLISVVPKELAYSSGGVPWYNSPHGIMKILYEVAQLKPILHKKTKKPTSDDAALEELAQREDAKWLQPIFSRIQALRSIGVFQSHFLDIQTGPNGRFLYQNNIAHPETFRWSSGSNPWKEGTNAQNLPKVEVD